ncbi:ABC transporter ATP-binding protein [Streptococcus macacae]|uniref:Sodium extrusion ABC transporter, ATP-binding protein NatA n=1 Tax=Streptococcus macacae NCTC 11558 TaxID=764298 RepID=G5JV58_9STRE|nr:ABC transporter ATP-binding protein [Streptococcus macacae]EHJ52980.1 putative sodium extrusion ABC transporter, ATP-binding protein NatA [Streptococcus macacae NCTC 11558]SUN77683.1 Methionine ABC transporter ATP-binding protein [Streptococcus macacae NCTC 11558]
MTINRGQVFALLGPNGAGKTSLIRIMLGLLKPEFGTVKISGTELTEATRSDLLLTIGVQNDGNLYENLTVKENLAIWGEIYSLEQLRISHRITEVSKMFRLEAYLEMPVGSLSKGNRQKVLLARAMFHNPDILILDEPTTGLDPEAVDEFYTFIKQLKKDNVTIIMCTHYLYGLDDLVDSIGVLKDGELLTSGEIRKLRNSDKIVHFYGRFNQDDVLRLNHLGTVSGNTKAEFSILLDNYDIVPAIVRELSSKGNDIDEIHRQNETLKEIYFRIIEGD